MNITKQQIDDLEDTWEELTIIDGLTFIKSPSNKVFIKLQPDSMRKGVFLSRKQQYEQLKELINSNEIEEAFKLL